MKISVCAYLKNAHKLKNPSYYARVKVDGRTHDIPLHTTEKAVAESWVRLRRSEIQRYNDYIACGEVPPEDLLSKLMPTVAQKGPSEAVSLIPVCLDGWEQELRQKGYRERSIDTYCKAIRNTVPDTANVSDFTSRNVLAWLGNLTHLKTSTRKSYSVSLREFAKFLIANYGLNRAVMDNWPMVKVQTEEKGFWTMPQMAAIINAVQCKDEGQTEVYKAFFWTLATVGSRCGETRELLWSDLVGNVITFRAENNKTNTTRRCPIDWRIAQMLNRIPRTGEYIFGSLPPSQASWHHVLQRAIKASGMPKGNLHQFRRSVSMMMYKASADIKLTAQYLCHGETTALRFYQAARQAEELESLVDKTYEHEVLIPNAMDELIKAGLV